LYIPGGTAALFSTVLMLGIRQNLRVGEIILCTPANEEGEVHPAILFSARLVGIDKIYKIGGAQQLLQWHTVQKRSIQCIKFLARKSIRNCSETTRANAGDCY
jgi:histidinol dehydrogenase